MLMDMKELLETAYKNEFAIGAFNVANSEFAKAVIQGAEAQHAPAIIQIHPLEIALMGDAFVAYLREAINKTHVPMALHLDHGGSVADVMRAIRNGYNSVMIDASHLNFEDNIALTAKVVEIAHSVGVAVEAELGTIGSNEGSGEGGADEILYTDPDQAKEFVERTGIDLLAVAIGTSHGIYPETKDHKIRVDLLKQIKEKVPVPMVLHGGSDNKDAEISAASQNGIAKINLASDMKKAFYDALRKQLVEHSDQYESFQVMPNATNAAQAIVEQKITLFGSSGKADLYK
ncbi:ketose-bisphosphate aldolase [Enterococcus avium]|uniref:ketose-bisphosphate aldolase n=1 Tax=Enterococcus avium TaxID=33945 RepID=UPI00159DA941|nr:ketose-bisphosphate aldolase [Enterococcus avium]NVN75505.1 ketose-bisphosphate aldolase [Enterococcus avium]